ASTGASLSVSHAGELTLAVAGEGSLACDIERVSARPAEIWQDLLGADRFRLARFIAQSAGEDLDRAATRVWGAIECLKKAGAGLDAPLAFASHRNPGWLLLESGSLIIASCAALGKTAEAELVITILADPIDGRGELK